MESVTDIMGAQTIAAATRERPAARHRKDRLSMLTQSPIFGDPRLPIRFWAKIHVLKGGCWEWQAGRSRQGYGKFLVGSLRDGSRKTVRVHRFTYELFIGP